MKIPIFILPLALFVGGCVNPPPARPNVTHDAQILSASADGFRIEMTPYMAKAVAAERGYTLDTRSGSLTFDDLVLQESLRRRGQGFVNLKRYDKNLGLEFQASLEFDFNRVTAIRIVIPYYSSDAQNAKKVFESYLSEMPYLVPESGAGDARLYSYKPSQHSSITISRPDNEYGMIMVRISDIGFAIDRVYGFYRKP